MTLTRREALSLIGSGLVAGIPRILQAQESSPDVIVVGAGLAGLHAAMVLEGEGLVTQVLEGRGRVGGRVKTLMKVPGRPEVGGEVIGITYARMIDVAQRLNLKLIQPPWLGPPTKWIYHLKGQLISADDWPSSPVNPFSGEDRKILPHRALMHIVNRDSPLKGRDLADWLTPEFAKYDIPLSDYLRDKGYSEDIIRLMGIAIHTDRIDNTSALHEMRRYHVGDWERTALGNQGSVLMIEGGNYLLPQAMAASLKRPVLTNTPVYAIEADDKGVTVHCDGDRSFRARYAVVSVPLPKLRDVVISPALSGPFAEAIRNMEYGLSLQVYMKVRSPFWEKDGLPIDMWTDTGMERLAAVVRGQTGPVTTLVAFINGAETRRFSFMTDAQCFEYVTAVLGKIRPSTKGQLELVSVQACHRDVFGAGDWIYWQPGQVRQYGNHLRDRSGRILFCGEHTAIMQRGMEAAHESGERAALEILDVM